MLNHLRSMGWRSAFSAAVLSVASLLAPAQDVLIRSENLTVNVRAEDGSYEIRETGAPNALLRASVGLKVDHRWVNSGEYPHHSAVQSTFEDEIGKGSQAEITFSGFVRGPDLVCVLRVYDDLPIGVIEVKVHNRSKNTFRVQAIRSLKTMGSRSLDLGASDNADRMFADALSEDLAALQINDVGRTRSGTYLAVENQMIYNQLSKKSAFFAALTARRFATLMHLHLRQDDPNSSGQRITSLTIDSAGTTEALMSSELSFPKQLAPENQIELSLPLAPGESISSEPLLFEVGSDYFRQLEVYGSIVGKLLHARVSAEPLMGWGSENMFDFNVTEGYIRSNAQWMAAHLKNLGFDYVHIEEGPPYARGEWTTYNRSKFPHGLQPFSQELSNLGLKLGGWIMPFQVDATSQIYQHHKNWLVHNVRGAPIRVIGPNDDNYQVDGYVLDITHPAAQEYIRQVCRVMAREWGVRYLRVDGMDYTLIEGYRHSPNVTALQTVEILLKLIRDAVGDDVSLEKDGGPMLSSVGFVDFARISWYTNHNFASTKKSEPGLAAHYYTHRKLWLNDPDYLDVQRVVPPGAVHKDGTPLPLLTLEEAQASAVLTAMSGAEYDIGDDLPTLGSEPDRFALATNSNLLQMAKLGRAAKALDLMTYKSEDEQPSILFLQESARQSMLAVFNWTEHSSSHDIELTDIGLTSGHTYKLGDGLRQDEEIPLEGHTISLQQQPPHSVRLIKIIDESQLPEAPALTMQAPQTAKVLEDLHFSAAATEDGTPALSYHWDFGDGVVAEGAVQTHAYTLPGSFSVKLVADGIDGVAAKKDFTVVVNGLPELAPPRRYEERPNIGLH